MIKAADADAQKAKSQGVKRVREWLEELLPIEERDEDDGGEAPPGKETSVIVNQLACMEAGCPDVETVGQLSRSSLHGRLTLICPGFTTIAGHDSAPCKAAAEAHVQNIQGSC